jgi:hypothetical protein
MNKKSMLKKRAGEGKSGTIGYPVHKYLWFFPGM